MWVTCVEVSGGGGSGARASTHLGLLCDAHGLLGPRRRDLGRQQRGAKAQHRSPAASSLLLPLLLMQLHLWLADIAVCALQCNVPAPGGPCRGSSGD